jgi:putative ABC transport system ATP-binding protein
VNDLGQTTVMVTHDPNAASYSDRVVFLADGHIVDELVGGSTDAIIDKMKGLGA